MCSRAVCEVYPGVGYTSFLIPGLVMMSVLQNAFANTSSSLVQSKITGNLVFLLVTPLSHWAWFAAYVGASVVRGLAVGSGVLAVTLWFVPLHLAEPGWIIVFGIFGAAMMGSLGLIAGLWAEKFDQMAAFQNFLIMPMTMLSGVFYSVHSLPPVLADRQSAESLLLHDRRLPARLLRPQRRLALAQSGGGGVGVCRRGPARAAAAGQRLQAAPVAGHRVFCPAPFGLSSAAALGAAVGVASAHLFPSRTLTAQLDLA
jgi:hypothetical protein